MFSRSLKAGFGSIALAGLLLGSSSLITPARVSAYSGAAPAPITHTECVDHRHGAGYNDPGESRIMDGVTFIRPFGWPFILAANTTAAIDKQVATFQQVLTEWNPTTGKWAVALDSMGNERVTPWVPNFWVYDNLFDLGFVNNWSPVPSDQIFQITHAGTYAVAYRVHWFAAGQAPARDVYRWTDGYVSLADYSFVDEPYCQYLPTDTITLGP